MFAKMLTARCISEFIQISKYQLKPLVDNEN